MQLEHGFLAFQFISCASHLLATDLQQNTALTESDLHWLLVNGNIRERHAFLGNAVRAITQ
jgi:hypothetical protein